MKTTNENVIRKYLKELGVPQNLLGYEYLVTAIELAIDDKKYIHNITKMLYPEIAKRHKTKPTRAERAIRHAIETSFSLMPYNKLEEIFSNTLDAKRGKPTNSHYIAAIAEVLMMNERCA